MPVIEEVMTVWVAGKGKLARELLSALDLGQGFQVLPWAGRDKHDEATKRSIVVHAGSGREIDALVRYCEQTQSVLLELATGSALEDMAPGFPLVMCPNTNILMLKFMAMLAANGAMFAGCNISLTESHQSQKTSTAGTALSLAKSLALPEGAVRSVRDPIEQESALAIPREHLGRHAYHHIAIKDGCCTLNFETRVYGDTPYADGVAKIVKAIRGRDLENRRYEVTEFITRGWL